MIRGLGYLRARRDAALGAIVRAQAARAMKGGRLSLSPRILIAVILSSLLVSGCLHKRYHTDSARSATEQLLITESVERAVAGLEIPPVSGRRVAFDVVGLGPGLEFYAEVMQIIWRRQNIYPDDGVIGID